MHDLGRTWRALLGRGDANHLSRARTIEVKNHPAVPVVPKERLLDLLPRKGIVAEIGVRKGRFAREILRSSRPSKLHLIDCWAFQDDEVYKRDSANVPQDQQDEVYESVKRGFRKEIARGVVVLHRAFSVEAAGSFRDGYFDWVFVDANHSYEAVKADLAAYLPKIKEGGFLAGDDYVQYGYYGVIPAVNEFVLEHGMEMVALTDEKTPSFVLRKRRG